MRYPNPKQKVHVGRTQSGVPGFFTGNTLAFHLTEEEFADKERHERLAVRLGFELEEKNDGTSQS